MHIWSHHPGRLISPTYYVLQVVSVHPTSLNPYTNLALHNNHNHHPSFITAGHLSYSTTMAAKAILTLVSCAALVTASIAPSSFHHIPHVHAHAEQQYIQQSISKHHQYQAHNFSVPVDHFHNDSRYEPHSHESFDLRYWLDDTYYRPGGPVIMIGSGEVSGAARLPFLATGIGKILAEATGGLAVVIEHRYYGTSYPVPDLSTSNMRFLSTEQALADTAYFAQHIQYAGENLKDTNITSATTPYIFYGGSYAGAFAALLRKIYPDVFAGAISGSGVPQVYLDFWEYLEAARTYVDPACVEMSETLVQIIDRTLTHPGDRQLADTLKGFFDLVDLPDDDFAYSVNWGLMSLQATHWDPDIDGPYLAEYCAAVTSDVPWYSSTRTLRDDAHRILQSAGLEDAAHLTPRFLNWIGRTRSYIKMQTDACGEKKKTPAECLSTRGAIDDESVPQGMLRSWTYQTCTQWGYFVTGTGVPEDRKPLMSRLVDLEYATMWCRDVFGIPAEPDMESINKYGGVNFSHSRVAFIDGEHDPWRQAGVHRIGVNEGRESTLSEPFILLEGGVHHWDQYGPKKNATGSWLPPKEVTDVQKAEIDFVKAWLKEWEQERAQRVAEGDEKPDPGLEL